MKRLPLILVSIPLLISSIVMSQALSEDSTEIIEKENIGKAKEGTTCIHNLHILHRESTKMLSVVTYCQNDITLKACYSMGHICAVYSEQPYCYEPGIYTKVFYLIKEITSDCKEYNFTYDCGDGTFVHEDSSDKCQFIPRKKKKEDIK